LDMLLDHLPAGCGLEKMMQMRFDYDYSNIQDEWGWVMGELD
jgi:hypothetical protein